MFECIRRSCSGERKEHIDILMEKDAFNRFSESVVASGISLREAAEAIRASVTELLEEVFGKMITDLFVSVEFPTDEKLRAVATAREWHLMNNAKKYRTRKKYKNRLIKRYINETQRRSKP